MPWAKGHESCICCGTTERPHMARGLCNRCYQRQWARRRPRMPKAVRPPPINSDELRRLYVDERLSSRIIAARVGVSKPTILRLLRKFEIPVQKASVPTWTTRKRIADANRLPTADFIKRCQERWGNKYDYSKTIYTAAKEDVIVTCPEHGDFPVLADTHARGKSECPDCRPRHKLRLARFLRIANEIHQGKYEYITVSDPIRHVDMIDITCPRHGLFPQQVGSHLNGCGCPTCANELKAERNRAQWISQAEIIKRFRQLHGDTYTYDRVYYQGLQIPILIGCRGHGHFPQTPGNHLAGKGCRKCGRAQGAKKHSKDTDWFVQEARKLFGDIYDYSQCVYTRKKDPVVIICDRHGPFKKTPDHHLRGQGCTTCSDETAGIRINWSILERNPYLGERRTTLYLARFTSAITSEDFLKIGYFSGKKPEHRFSGRGTRALYSVIIVASGTATLYEVFTLEQQILEERKNDEQHVPEERFHGYTECLTHDGWNRIRGIRHIKTQLEDIEFSAITRN